MIKKILYKLLDIVTGGKGIPRNFGGHTVKMPTAYFRYFPKDYEKENFNFINSELKEGMTVLDIGAHIGLMAVVFGKKVGNTGKVYAFEPTPTTVNILRHTIRINKSENISVEPYALADQKGKLTFYISDNLVDNGNSLVNNQRTDRKERGIEVDVNTVDDFVMEKGVGKIDFIKIDVEGAELRLLRGAQHTLRKDKPKVILSIHPASIRNFGDSSSEIWELVNDMGYKVMFDSLEIKEETFLSKDDLFDVFLVQ